MHPTHSGAAHGTVLLGGGSASTSKPHHAHHRPATAQPVAMLSLARPARGGVRGSNEGRSTSAPSYFEVRTYDYYY